MQCLKKDYVNSMKIIRICLNDIVENSFHIKRKQVGQIAIDCLTLISFCIFLRL